jgi:hypothetical protein
VFDGGTINFVIDSGSFNDIKTSGSLAKIKTKVNSIGTGGAQGKLAFELSKGVGGQSIEAFEYGYAIGGRSLMTSVQTASLIITDHSSLGTSILEMRDSTEGSRFSVEEGNVEISGSLGVTGSATFNSGITSTALTLTSPPVQGSEGTSLMINGSGVVGTRELGSIAFFQGDQNLRQADSPTFTGLTVNGTASIAYFETLYETSSIIYSSGSTKFGDTMDDFHDFTGSVDITGSTNVVGNITASGDISASGDLYSNRLFLGPNGTAQIETSTGDNEFLFSNRAHWRKSNAYISSRGNEWVLSGNGISEPNNYTEAYVHIAKEGGALKALPLVSISNVALLPVAE